MQSAGDFRSPQKAVVNERKVIIALWGDDGRCKSQKGGGD
jgi:hypothetical protein